MNTKLNPNLEKILSNNTSGSIEILLELREYFLSYKLNFKEVENDLNLIGETFSDFAIISDFTKNVTKASKNNFEEFQLAVSIYFQNHDIDRKHLLENAIKLLGKYNSFITISNSITIKKFLELFARKKPDTKLVVCESRPQFEGRITAETLIDKIPDTHLITEAQIPEYMENVDCVITSADKIFRDGSIINKVGSKMLAIAAKHYSKPYYIISGKKKFSNNNEFQVQEKDPDEVYSTLDDIKIRNVYFEKIEKDLITGVITEKGVLL